MVNFYDDFLEEHIAQLIDMQLKDVSWKFDYDSVENGLNKHWHVFCWTLTKVPCVMTSGLSGNKIKLKNGQILQ